MHNCTRITPQVVMHPFFLFFQVRRERYISHD
nr:MAG TPA: hypothetical protein [Caudoviricetes sp.]